MVKVKISEQVFVGAADVNGISWQIFMHSHRFLFLPSHLCYPALKRSFVVELCLKLNSCILQDSLTSAEDKDNKFSRRGSLLFEVLGVLHNLSKRTNNKKHFDDSSAVETLLSFFRTKFPVYRMTALLALAYLVDEKNNHLIMASDGK